MGINNKLIKVAAGHIFQLEIIASPIFYLHCSTPFSADATENYLIKLLKTKNPERKAGANNN
jgi:hypothetical protein